MLNHKCEKLNAGATRPGTRIQFTNARHCLRTRRTIPLSLCPLLLLFKKRSDPFCGGAVLPRRPNCYGFTASSRKPPFWRIIQSEEPIKMKTKPNSKIALINHRINHLCNFRGKPNFKSKANFSIQRWGVCQILAFIKDRFFSKMGSQTVHKPAPIF
jgi:hypothetical protein